MTVSYGDIPVGIEDFEKLINFQKKYIDKTSFLRDLLTSGIDVTLLLRPRRFGKTLSMSMIEKFLEINYQDPEDRSKQKRLFEGFDVYKDRELCDKFMGRYPVISISLKSVQGRDFTQAMISMLRLLGDFFNKYRFLLNSEKQSDVMKNYLKQSSDTCFDGKINLREASSMDTAVDIAKNSLLHVSKMLFEEYGRQVAIIVDEYDVPLQKAKVNNYYDDMLDVVRNMLGNALKTNSSMMKGFITGCLRIAHQSIFTGINNFVTCGLNDMHYSDFIGLTKNETVKLLKECNMENRLNDVQTWYDGYSIAGKDMLCPWSVMNFLSNALLPGNNPSTFTPGNYWVNSSGNDIIELCMRHPNSTDSQRLQNLINGDVENIEPSEFTTYPEINTATDFDTFATMMLHTGYLTYAKTSASSSLKDKIEVLTESDNEDNGDEIAEKIAIKIPNKEILDCFRLKRNYLFSRKNPEWVDKVYMLRDALFAGKPEDVQKIINNMLMTFISFRDTSYESYYHGFMTGVLSMVTNEDISLQSNRESGNGYSDVILKNSNNRTAVVLEFKRCDNNDPITRARICADALNQINEKKYDFDLKQWGCTDIIKYGIAFYGKGCTVKKAG
jgi:hypothetical protein